MSKNSHQSQLDLVGCYACVGDLLDQQMIISTILLIPEFCVSLPGMVKYKGKAMASIMNHHLSCVYGATTPGCKSFNNRL